VHGVQDYGQVAHCVRPLLRITPSPRLGVSLFFGINGFLGANWVSRIPAVVRKLEIGMDTLGTVLLLFAVGAIIAFPICGRSTSTRGSALVTTFFGLFFCVTVPMLAFSPNVWWLALSLTLYGLANGGVDVAMNAQGVEIELATGRKIMGSLHGFYSLGGLLGAGTGALAAWLDTSLEWHFTTLSVLGFGILAWAATGLIQDRTREGTKPESGGFVIPPRILWPLGIIAFCSALGEGAMADWSALYLHEHLGSRESVAAIGFFVFSLTMLTGRFLGDGIVAKFGPVTVIRTCAIIATAGLLFGIAVDEIWSALIGFGAVGLGLSIVIPLVYGAAGNTQGIPGGRGVASVATIGYTGFLAGPAALGWVAEATSLRIAMLIVVMLSGVVVVMAGQADPRRRLPAR
jgi:MFS family permease